MAFSQTNRIWWDTTKPGAGTANLQDATPSPATPASEDEDTGTVSLHKGEMVVCARSGFTVPLSETVEDPYTGRRVWARFADHIHMLDEDK